MSDISRIDSIQLFLLLARRMIETNDFSWERDKENFGWSAEEIAKFSKFINEVNEELLAAWQWPIMELEDFEAKHGAICNPPSMMLSVSFKNGEAHLEISIEDSGVKWKDDKAVFSCSDPEHRTKISSVLLSFAEMITAELESA